jgi:ADP-ribose pyrophosphatase YjhB (NUDIX family)
MKYVVCHDVWGKKRKIPATKLFFRPSVYGVIIEKGRVLLSKQWDGYDFPGGGSEIYETIEDTLQREIWEETGLRVKLIRILWAGSSFFSMPFVKKHANCILVYYLCKRIGGKLSTKNLDKREKMFKEMSEWVPVKKIGRTKFYNSVDNRAIVRLALQAKRKS